MDKKFGDWSHIDCNDCQHYWNDTCDGTQIGTEKPCTSFLATRRVDIPEQIKWLRKRLNGLNWAFIFLSLAVVLHLATHLLGG